MTELLAENYLGALRPIDDESAETLRALPRGRTIRVKCQVPRNARSLQHHRMFFGLLKLAFENQSTYRSIEHLRAALTVAVGHCDFVPGKDGLIAVPKSIRFDKMDQDEFGSFFNKCADVLAETIGVTPDDLKAEAQAEMRMG